MATVQIGLCADAGCKKHITFTVVDGSDTESFIVTKAEVLGDPTDKDRRKQTILQNAITYGRKRKAESATWGTIITEIEAKEFSI